MSNDEFRINKNVVQGFSPDNTHSPDLHTMSYELSANIATRNRNGFRLADLVFDPTLACWGLRNSFRTTATPLVLLERQVLLLRRTMLSCA